MSCAKRATAPALPYRGTQKVKEQATHTHTHTVHYISVRVMEKQGHTWPGSGIITGEGPWAGQGRCAPSITTLTNPPSDSSVSVQSTETMAFNNLSFTAECK